MCLCNLCKTQTTLRQAANAERRDRIKQAQSRITELSREIAVSTGARKRILISHKYHAEEFILAQQRAPLG